MTSATDWRSRVGDVWAAEWRRTDRSLADLSRHLDAAIRSAAPMGPGAALDIGCGAGATSLALAAARPDLAITGVDLFAPLVEIARSRVPTARFHIGDVAHDPLDLAPDLLFSRHGVMFFADPAAAFTRLRAAAAPGAPLVFSCFRDRALNAFASDLVMEVTGERSADPPGYAPGPFAFASRDRVEQLLAQTGWTAASATPVDFAYVAGAGEDPVADAVDFLTRIGPLASAIAAAPDGARLRERLADALCAYRTNSHVQLSAAAWIWRAQAGDRP